MPPRQPCSVQPRCGMVGDSGQAGANAELAEESGFRALHDALNKARQIAENGWLGTKERAVAKRYVQGRLNARCHFLCKECSPKP